MQMLLSLLDRFRHPTSGNGAAHATFLPKAHAVLTALAIVTGSSMSADAAEIRILSTNAMTDSMHDVAPLFEKATGHKLVVTFEPTNLIIERLKRGETADVILLVKGNLQDLVGGGQIAKESVVDIARTRIGIAVREGGRAIDVSSIEAFKASVLASSSIAVSKAGASGIQFQRALERHGILEGVRSRLKPLEGASRAGDSVAKGDVEVGVQMISELAPIAGLKVFAPLPGDFNFEITVSGGVMTGSGVAGPAGELVRFIASPGVSPLLLAKGLEPI